MQGLDSIRDGLMDEVHLLFPLTDNGMSLAGFFGSWQLLMDTFLFVPSTISINFQLDNSTAAYG